MQICDKKCMGCAACYSACPVDAIEMKPDIRGFLVPVIRQNICIRCNKCRQICPLNAEFAEAESNIQTVYSCWTQDDKTRKESSSGGMFTVFAKQILKEKPGAGVFGAAYDSEWKVVHQKIDGADELYRLRGSKYVQSDIGESYEEAERMLKTGQTVLFTGTPCQIAGLKSYLGKEYEELYTIDLLCHGVPSPMIFKQYINYMKEKHGKDIRQLQMRYKKPSWSNFSTKITFGQGKKLVASKFKDPYMIGFLRNLYLRKSCHECRYASKNRVGDLTIADFWGYQAYTKETRNDQRGISLVTVNSAKGKQLFARIQNHVFAQEQSLDYAIRGNQGFLHPWEPNEQSEMFWYDFEHGMEYEKLISKYCRPGKASAKTKLLRFIEDYGHIAPIGMIVFVKKFVKID